MCGQRLQRRARLHGFAGGVVALALLAVSGSWAEPPDGHDGRQPDAYPADCPGRLHDGDHGAVPSEPPALVRYYVAPYGVIWGYPLVAPLGGAAPVAPRREQRAKIYHVVDCPAFSLGDRFPGLDVLVTLMGHEGLKFYKSSTVTMESGPDGLIAADDVVVIKINYQWSERGGTNTDVLRGLIRRIVDHPDTFTGEIAVCENAQFASTSNFDRPLNNAEDHSLSPHDVVMAFQLLGYTVSHFDWTVVRYTEVDEYEAGDTTDGYVLYPYDAQLTGRVSYPKFRTDYGTYVSSKYGIWDPVGETYDRQSLKFINVPVLKSHGGYGVTACVKHYMGVVTGALSTNSHSAIHHGILGALMGEIQIADLNILDCIWINAHPSGGPGTSYAEATRRDELVASVDSVAADYWATKNILIPGFIDNGHSPPFSNADPDDPSSTFRQYLDNSMDYILAAGYDATNDGDQIDAVTWSGGRDTDGDGEPSATDNCPYDPNPDQDDYDGDGIGDACECAGDADSSGDVTVTDFLALLAAWGPCPACPEDFDQSGAVDVADFLALLANWGSCY
ncbi:MAG: DUF362 domain-containing protein [Planctomycetota bacterium]|jgi:hypothetical protein